MTFSDGMRTSATPEWGTPRDLFEKLDAEFHFDVDVCATTKNAKCSEFWTKTEDGLAQEWTGRVCWMNPPYGREIGNWVRKAYEASLQGATVVCLIPSRTDTAWWHEWAMRGEIRFLRGRLRFTDEEGTPQGSAPFPSAVVIFRPAAEAVA